MAMNRVQFQPGLSMPEFLRQFGTEAQCEAALERVRWPQGFRCPHCGESRHCVLRVGTRKVFQCGACRKQTSLIAGTVFQGTKLALTVWYLAIYFISQAKTGLSALALKRLVGVSYPTAWLIHPKLMQAMVEREERCLLGGEVRWTTLRKGSGTTCPGRPGISREANLDRCKSVNVVFEPFLTSAANSAAARSGAARRRRCHSWPRCRWMPTATRSMPN